MMSELEEASPGLDNKNVFWKHSFPTLPEKPEHSLSNLIFCGWILPAAVQYLIKRGRHFLVSAVEVL